MPELREGQTGTAPDGTRVVVRNGQIVPAEASVSATGAAAAGFQDLGDGWFRGPDGGTFQRNRQGQLIQRSGGANGDEGSQRTARKDFEALGPVSAFREAQSYYGSIQDAVSASDGASDQVLVIAFNKMLDPDSVVREGEYDRAKDIAGALEGLRLQANRALTGDGLTPRMRQQIADASQAMYEVRRDQYNDTAQRYQGLAREDGLNPEAIARQEFSGQRIARDPTRQEMGQANTAQVAARPDNYDRQSPLGSPTRPYVLSPGVTIDQLPPGSSYIDQDGTAHDPNAPQPGDVRLTSQPLAPTDTPNSLSRDGYIYDGATDTWRRNRQEQVASPESRGWTPESAVAQRRNGDDSFLGGVGRHVDAFMRGAADQPMGEFADEMAGGADALFGQGVGQNFFERWGNNNQVQRAVDRADGQDMPLTRFAGEAVGTAAGGALMFLGGGAARAAPSISAKVAEVANGAGRVANSFRSGAIGGGIAGAVNAAGNSQGGLVTRGQNAVAGGLVGALGGAVLEPLIGATAPVLNAIAQPAVRMAGRNVGNVLNRMGFQGGAAMAERNTPNPLTSGMARLSEMTPVDTSRATSEASAFRENGIAPTFFDVAGDGAQATGRAAATRQTPARQRVVDFAGQRRVGAQDRVSEIARRNISDDPRTASQFADDLEADQSRLSSAEMGPIRDNPVRLMPETATIFRTPGGRAAIEQSRAWAGNSRHGEELAALARLADDSLDNPGQIELSLGTVDRLRRSLSNQAKAAKDNDSRQGLTSLSRQLRANATHQEFGVPQYETFLNNYADRAQIDDAVDFGANFLNRRGTADFARQASEMNAPQNAAARVSARDRFEEAGNTPAGAATLLSDVSVGRGNGQRTDGLLGADAPRLQSNAQFARRELETGNNINPRTGSQTNDNAQNSGLVDGVAQGIGVARDLAVGNKFGLATRAVDMLRSKGFSNAEAEAVLTAGIDPGRTDELIQMLIQRGSTPREARSTARAVRYFATTSAGRLTGETLSSQ